MLPPVILHLEGKKEIFRGKKHEHLSDSEETLVLQCAFLSFSSLVIIQIEKGSHEQQVPVELICLHIGSETSRSPSNRGAFHSINFNCL